MSDKKVPKIKFNNGQEFPLFGLGTWKVSNEIILERKLKKKKKAAATK